RKGVAGGRQGKVCVARVAGAAHIRRQQRLVEPIVALRGGGQRRQAGRQQQRRRAPSQVGWGQAHATSRWGAFLRRGPGEFPPEYTRGGGTGASRRYVWGVMRLFAPAIEIAPDWTFGQPSTCVDGHTALSSTQVDGQPQAPGALWALRPRSPANGYKTVHH